MSLRRAHLLKSMGPRTSRGKKRPETARAKAGPLSSLRRLIARRVGRPEAPALKPPPGAALDRKTRLTPMPLHAPWIALSCGLQHLGKHRKNENNIHDRKLECAIESITWIKNGGYIVSWNVL
jgi:hypothetical protein